MVSATAETMRLSTACCVFWLERGGEEGFRKPGDCLVEWGEGV